MPFVRYPHARADMVSHPFPSFPRLNAGKNVKAGFKPGGEAMRDLERFVKSVIGSKNSVARFPLTVDGIVAVEFDHRMTRVYCFRRIYLDFVIVLAAAKDRNSDHG